MKTRNICKKKPVFCVFKGERSSKKTASTKKSSQLETRYAICKRKGLCNQQMDDSNELVERICDSEGLHRSPYSRIIAPPEVPFMTKKFNVDEKILQCIEDALEILGNSGKATICYYLKKKVGLKKEDIPKKPELFSKGLIMIFGEEATAVIEKNLVKKLAACFNLKNQPKITLTGILTMIKGRRNPATKNFSVDE
jgi:hypothetical protein